jgi:folate-dependent phosphoribosylglycinamide formyltransferase PurN
MKTVVLCSKIANHKALVHKLSAVVPLSAIALIEVPQGRLAPRIARWFTSVTVGLPLRRAWNGMTTYFDQLHPEYPDVEISHHQNVNAQSVVDLVERVGPELVIVSGTNLLKQPLIDAISRTARILNLHTGISPFVKGGPNCTNWCLALGEFDLIGNTIMWLDVGIDNGRIIASERTPLTGEESLEQLQIKVIEHGHDLYLRVIQRLRSGEPLPSVPQRSIGGGRLLLFTDWTAEQAVRALFNYYTRYSAASLEHKRDFRLVSPDETSIRTQSRSDK